MTKLDDLDARLKNARAQYEKEEAPQPGAAYSKEMNLGLRAFMEMIGVLLGSGLMGWALDDYFGTAPIILLLFVILGVGAAFFNLYKLSQNLGTAIASNSLQSETKPDRKPSQSESD